MIFDLTKYCSTSEDHCDILAATKRMQAKVFQIIGKINDIAEAYSDMPTFTEEEIKAETNVIGNDIGQLIRIIFDIKML